MKTSRMIWACLLAMVLTLDSSIVQAEIKLKPYVLVSNQFGDIQAVIKKYQSIFEEGWFQGGG